MVIYLLHDFRIRSRYLFEESAIKNEARRDVYNIGTTNNRNIQRIHLCDLSEKMNKFGTFSD